MHFYDTVPQYHGDFFYGKYYQVFVLGQNMTPIWKKCLAKLYSVNLSIHQDPKNNWRVPFKIQFLRASRLFRSASIRVHVEVLKGLTNNNSL